MNVARKRDRVKWQYPGKEKFHGTVTRVRRDGDVYVKWDDGGNTRLHPSVLEKEDTHSIDAEIEK